MIHRTILEWQALRHGTGEDEIEPWVADRLAAAAAASPLAGRSGDAVLEHRRTSLRARGVVGVIAADGAVLEILPKIDLPNASGENALAGLRRKLVHMLGVALDLRVEAGATSAHDWQRETLLEVLIRIFTTRLTEAVRQGMPRQYVACEDDLSALRGRLNAQRQFTTLAASPQRLASRFDDFSADVPINQIMKAAIRRLTRAARSADNQRRLAELGFAYADITDVRVGALRWDRVTLDRTNERWRELVELARLLLGERFQTTSVGQATGFSLLFEMNLLFEAYIARLLSRALAGTDLTVSAQGGRLYCLQDNEERGLFQTRPDILVRRGGEVTQVIDTKWKRISSNTTDPKGGVSQADVYQLMAYSQLYRCPRVMLLYPHHGELPGEGGLQSSHRIVSSDGDRLAVATVNLAFDQTLTAALLKTVCCEWEC